MKRLIIYLIVSSAVWASSINYNLKFNIERSTESYRVNGIGKKEDSSSLELLFESVVDLNKLWIGAGIAPELVNSSSSIEEELKLSNTMPIYITFGGFISNTLYIKGNYGRLYENFFRDNSNWDLDKSIYYAGGVGYRSSENVLLELLYEVDKVIYSSRDNNGSDTEVKSSKISLVLGYQF